jgi:hypothetical protein
MDWVGGDSEKRGCVYGAAPPGRTVVTRPDSVIRQRSDNVIY